MANRGDTKDRVEGEHDSVELSDKERAEFDQLAASAQNPYDTAGYDADSSSGEGPDYTGQSHREAHVPGRRQGAATNPLAPDQLKNQEEGGSGLGGIAGAGLAGLAGAESKGNSGSGPFNYKNNGARFSGARGFLQKHKKKLIAGGLVGAGIVPIIVLILFIAAALKVPNFVSNVAAWRFAKLTRQYRASVNNVVGEKNALDSLSDADYQKATQKYGKYRIFDGVNRLRPNRVLQSMQAADRVQYNYETTFTGRQKLKSITITPDRSVEVTENGKTVTKARVTIDVPSGKFDRILHPFQTLDNYKTLADTLDIALKAHDPKISVITRTLVTKQVLQKAGASLRGLVASKYLGKNNAADRLSALQSQFAESTKKLNELETQLNGLTSQYDQIYRQKQAFYNSEWAPVYKDWLAAQSEWTLAYNQFQATTSPSADLITRVENAGNQLDAAVKEFEAKSGVLTEFATKAAAINTQISGIQTEMSGIYNERTSLLNSEGTLSDRDAKIQIEQDTYETAHRTGGIDGMISDEKQVAQDAADAQDAAVKDKTQMGQLVDSGADVPDSVDRAVQNALTGDNLQSTIKKVGSSVVGLINPLYDIAVPVCMIYDGSKITSQGVDAQHDSVVSEAANAMAINDQMQNGNAFSSVMANAVNWKFGDTQNTNALRRVNGKPVNTLDGVNGQRTTIGTYGEKTILDVFHLGILNAPADSLCPALTNIWVGLGIGVVNVVGTVVLSFFTGGGAGAGEAAATAAAREGADRTITTVVKKFTENAVKNSMKGFRAGGRFAKQFAKDTTKFTVAVDGATFLAAMLVESKAGVFSSGLERNAAYGDNVDDGATQLASDLGAQNFYGRPMNNTEVANMHAADAQESMFYNEHLSTFDRYFALSNPNSLASRSVLTTSSLVNRSMFASLLNGLANLFNPVGLTSKLFAGVNAQATFAAGNANTQDYGNVVWGYSNAELALMSQSSYRVPSENSYVLDQSGKKDEIESKYSVCYTQSIGALLESHKIVRDDATGDVQNQGDCAPVQLGPNNPTYGDLVFRWRLEHNYQNTSDALNNVQDPNASTSTVTSLGGIPSGTAQQLAQQIISNGNISFQTPAEEAAMKHIADTGHGTACGAPAVSPTLLGVLLAAASKYKIVIGVLVDGHSCNSGFHPQGMAADINGVTSMDGKQKTNDGRHITATDYSSNNPILVSFYNDVGKLLDQSGGGGLGQYFCWGNAPAKVSSKVQYFDDTCDHLHMDVGKR